MILKMASVLSLQSCSFGVPILVEETKAAGVTPVPQLEDPPTLACDRLQALSQWNVVGDQIRNLNATRMDRFIAEGVGIYGSGVFSPKEIKLLSIVFDASYTQMYPSGTFRQIKATFRARCVGAEDYREAQAMRCPGCESMQSKHPDSG